MTIPNRRQLLFLSIPIILFISCDFGVADSAVPLLVKRVELAQQKFCCDKTTEAGADEVYILVYGRRSDGQTYQQRIPGPGHWDMNDGDQPDDNPSGDSHCIHNKPLFVGEIPLDMSWDILVLVMEEDGGNSANWQRAASTAAIKSGNPYAVAGGAILAVYTQLFGGIINDTDDYIGSFAIHINNDAGQTEITWRAVDRVVHVQGGSNRTEIRMNGDGTNYVSWYEVKTEGSAYSERLEKAWGDGMTIPSGGWKEFGVRFVDAQGRPISGAKIAWNMPGCTKDRQPYTYIGETDANGVSTATNMCSIGNGTHIQTATVVGSRTPKGFTTGKLRASGPATSFTFKIQ